MTMQAWVPAGKDELIVNVTGANPSTQETADLHLWSGRTPTAAASGRDRQPGPDLGGQLPDRLLGADLRRDGRDHRRRAERHRLGRQLRPRSRSPSPRTPTARSGWSSPRPTWTGGNAATTASTLIGSDATTAASTLLATQSSWWNGYWANAGLIEANSSDGTAQYMENLRTLYLYDEAASMHSRGLPGQPGGRRGHVRLRPGPAGLVPGRVLAVEPARPDRREPVVRQLQPQPADLQHVPQRPAGDRVVDQRADGRAGRGVRARDDAVQRQRLLQRRHQLPERLLRHRVQPELQRRGHHLRRGDRAVDLAAVRGHRQPQLPAEVLPDHGADREVPARLPEASAPTATCTPSPTRTRPSGRCRTRPPTWPPTRPCSPPPSAPPPC